MSLLKSDCIPAGDGGGDDCGGRSAVRDPGALRPRLWSRRAATGCKIESAKAFRRSAASRARNGTLRPTTWDRCCGWYTATWAPRGRCSVRCGSYWPSAAQSRCGWLARVWWWRGRSRCCWYWPSWMVRSAALEMACTIGSGLLLCLPAGAVALLLILLNGPAYLALALVVFPKVHRYLSDLVGATARMSHIVTAKAKGVSEARDSTLACGSSHPARGPGAGRSLGGPGGQRGHSGGSAVRHTGCRSAGVAIGAWRAIFPC